LVSSIQAVAAILNGSLAEANRWLNASGQAFVYSAITSDSPDQHLLRTFYLITANTLVKYVILAV
jgi:hypothetical protein